MTKTPKEMISELLKKGVLNAQELAKEIGVAPSQITRWLGSAEPRLSHFRKIEEIYTKKITKKGV